MTRMLGSALFLAGAALLGSACSDEFTDCRETHTCEPKPDAGGAGEGGAKPDPEPAEGGASGASMAPEAGAGGSCDGTICDGVCTNTDGDPEHCGDCETSCGDDKPLCASGECVASCPADAPEQCGGSCADFDTDPVHCGDCETQCPEAKTGSVSTCVAGKCQTECLDPCPAVDNGTAACVDDACATQSCNPGFKLCDGKCVDPAVDNTCGGLPLSAGSGVACAIKSGGTVWCWSANNIGSPAQVSGLTSIVQLSVNNATCGLKSDGTIWQWNPATPATPPTDISDGLTFRQVGSGHEADDGICAVASSNKVYCRNTNKWVLKATPAATAVSVDRQSHRAYARGTDGSIWSWEPAATPKQDEPSGYAQVETAEDSLVLRTTAGGVLYNGASVSTGELNTTFVQVTAGLRGGCALGADGSVWCWGYGPYGQLGNSQAKDSDTMVRFGGTGFRASAVSRGQIWTCALKTDGTVWCAGDGVPSGGNNGIPKQVAITVP